MKRTIIRKILKIMTQERKMTWDYYPEKADIKSAKVGP
jgi:hypothetical protein